MADRKERRFIVHEQMRKRGYSNVNDHRHSYDNVNDEYRSFFAMHWRNWPNLKIIPIIRRKNSRHTKRNLGIVKKEAVE